MIDLVIVDDHEVVRQGLRRIVEAQEDMRVVAEGADGSSVMDLVAEARPDVLLLDVTMPGPGVEAVIQAVKDAFPDTGVLVLSIHPEELYGVRVLRAGADGYLSKGKSADELVGAVRRVQEGEVFVSPAVAQALANHVRSAAQHAGHELTEREKEVLGKLGSGATVAEIAAELDLSPKTVASHRSHIREKLGLSSNAALVRYAVERGLVG